MGGPGTGKTGSGRSKDSDFMENFERIRKIDDPVLQQTAFLSLLSKNQSSSDFSFAMMMAMLEPKVTKIKSIYCPQCKLLYLVGKKRCIVCGEILEIA